MQDADQPMGMPGGDDQAGDDTSMPAAAPAAPAEDTGTDDTSAWPKTDDGAAGTV